ncbi:MAG: ParA family protein [Alphaproteobacteria bacterium]|jgi:chromosome partitioning protein|nr:ParA family protein [Alphaproteobacteria bacterium]MBT5389574.1 ParA family protein [Alphaproteobacteria bacterium]MBT5540523.1 ParA family protein [Alphaproteobacteria bacterium]MBT5654433.1 ParA family protein [Alphaproteobacteria bacterium]
MSKIISIANQKGGVGKTTTSINLATGLAATCKNVLLVDLDPQGNATTGLGIRIPATSPGVYEALLSGAPFSQVVTPTEIPRLDILPSTQDLAGAEIELVSASAREFFLNKLLSKVSSHYDYIFIDCPPSLGLLTLNALVASDAVLIPLQCEFFALQGLSQLLETINRVQKKLNKSLSLEGIVLTMFDRRNSLSRQVMLDVKAHLGEYVYNTVIPRNVRVAEAPSHGKPLLLYDTRCSGSEAYMKLAKEFLAKKSILKEEIRHAS